MALLTLKYMYLFVHRQRCHSQHVFRGFSNNEPIRQIRNTSDNNKLINFVTNFKVKLLERGYDNVERNDSISDVLSILNLYSKINRSTIYNGSFNY